jgi:hypothetical protein
MALEPKHSGIVQTCSILAAIAGLVFGAVPGSDLVFLILIWLVGSILILSSRTPTGFMWFTIKLVLAVLTAGITLGVGVEIATFVTLPIFWLINPLLNYLATYRVLRAFSKLFARKDPEEVTSSVASLLFAILKMVFFGDADLGDATDT